MSGLSDGKIRLYERRPPTAMSIHAWYVKMSYNTLPLVAGFLPVLPDARGANVCAMFFTLLSVTLLVGGAAFVPVSALTASASACALIVIHCYVAQGLTTERLLNLEGDAAKTTM
jgi:hypothetical protein